MVSLSVAKRVKIKFLPKKGVKPCKILTQLKAQHGNKTLSKTKVFNWAKNCKSLRESVANSSKNRRSRSSITADNVG